MSIKNIMEVIKNLIGLFFSIPGLFRNTSQTFSTLNLEENSHKSRYDEMEKWQLEEKFGEACAASGTENLKEINRIIDAGVNINVKIGVTKGTPFWIACNTDHLKAAERLLECGADPFILDEDKKTALMAASEYGNIETMQLALSLGINIDQQDNDGNTACIIAAENGFCNAVEFLLARNANKNLKTKDGLTAKASAEYYLESYKNSDDEDELAKIKDYEKIIQLLS